ncbi:hypothetical protein ACHAPU_006985 [Fusarium lateritium]
MDSISRTPLGSSLYTSDFCEIFFRDKGPLHITRGALKKCPKLLARLQTGPWREGPFDWADIQHLSIEAGHVLIHFLVTDRYECLKPGGTTEEERNRCELTTAFHVYSAAGPDGVDLPRLQELAEAEIKRLECKMNLVSVAQTLENSLVSLEVFPVLEKHFLDELDIVLTTSNKQEIDSLISHLGARRKVSMIFLERLLELQKQLLDAEAHKQEEVATPRPWDEFELELEALVKRFSGELSVPKELGYQHTLRAKAISDSLNASALENQKAIKGELCVFDQAQLDQLKHNCRIVAKDLSECQSEIAASRERLEQLETSARSIVERIIAEQQIEPLLECQKEQEGLLSAAQRRQLSRLRKKAGVSIGQTQSRSEGSVSSEESDESTDDGMMTPVTDSSEDEREGPVLSNRPVPTKPRAMASLVDRLKAEEPPPSNSSTAAITPGSRALEDKMVQPRKESQDKVATLRQNIDQKRVARRTQQQDQEDVLLMLICLTIMVLFFSSWVYLLSKVLYPLDVFYVYL